MDAGKSREPKEILRPVSSTKADLADHEPLHSNYRSWCPDSVWGTGHRKHHRVSMDGPKQEVTWHMDDCIFHGMGLEEQEE